MNMISKVAVDGEAQRLRLKIAERPRWQRAAISGRHSSPLPRPSPCGAATLPRRCSSTPPGDGRGTPAEQK